MASVTHLRSKIPADTLPSRLRALRFEKGWSQREAADATGVPFGVWQGMERGRGTRGVDRHVSAIAASTGYDRDWLMWGGPLAPPENPTSPISPAARNTVEYSLLRLVEPVAEPVAEPLAA